MTCPAAEKPPSDRPCLGICPPRWVVGDWSECEGVCPTGVQKREVRCIDAQGQISKGCDDDMPVVKRTCACYKKQEVDLERLKPVQDEPVDGK